MEYPKTLNGVVQNDSKDAVLLKHFDLARHKINF